MSSSYCSSCQIEIQNDDSLRDHYKAEVHRYNIKRKLVGLPPVTIDQFSNKKAQLLAESSQSEKGQQIKCDVCSKSFASKATYKQHLESRKHRENLRKFNQNARNGGEGAENKEERPLTTTAEDQSVCLFCNKKSADIEENLVHMRLTHSFFISEWKHLKNLQGLLKHIGNKIHIEGMCIYCGIGANKEVKSGESVQNHMLAKGHIFMNNEDFEEYEKFYDFTKVIEDFRKHGLIADGDGALLGGDDYMDIVIENEEDEEERDHSDDGDWEVIDNKQSPKKAGDNGNKERVYKLKKAKLLDSGEILLPNGQILGHRRFRHVYKQYFRETAKQNQLEENYLEYADEKVIAARQEETRLAALKAEVVRKERNLTEAQVNKVFQRKEREALKLGMRSNKTTQQHFRRAEN